MTIISPIGVTKRNSAFTLIEILLVVVIAGIVLALSVPNFSKGFSRFQLNKTADDLLSVSRWAQAMAIGQQRIYALSFSDDRHSYGLLREKIIDETNGEINDDASDQDSFEAVHGTLGKMHAIPDAVTLDTDNDRIEFHPDGTIDPATIQLASSDKQVELSSVQVRGLMIKVDDE